MNQITEPGVKQVRIIQQSLEDEDTYCPLHTFIQDNLDSLSPLECYYLNLMGIGMLFYMGTHFGWVHVLRIE